MKGCPDFQLELSAWLDGELPRDVAEPLEAHLACCAECRALADSLRQLDQRLTESAASDSEAARRVAFGALARLAAANAPDHDVSESTTSRAATPLRSNFFPAWLRYLSAAAAGFLAAWLLYARPAPPPVARSTTDSRDSIAGENAKASADASPNRVPAPPPVATLTVATGAVELRQPGESTWSLAAPGSPLQCPSGSSLRTGPGVRCELETPERCAIRLNESTELTLHSPRDVELNAGQIWCSAPADATLQVTAAASRTPNAAAPESLFRCAIPSNGALVGEVNSAGGWQVMTPTGEIEVSLGPARQRLKPGEIAKVEGGKLSIEPHHADAVLVTSWMHPLLVMKGHDSPELDARVNRLLAHLGRSKLENLYEHEIRSLGEHAALPLLRFVESPLSRDDPERRRRAMELAADIATTWLVNDLIRLLADDQPEVRVAAATALRRLTRVTHGRLPEQWSAPLDQLQESLERWRLWQLEDGRRYESPRPRKSPTPNSPL